MDYTKEANKEEKAVGEPVKLNIYDLTDMNGYMYWFGLGVYHSAIEGGLTNFIFFMKFPPLKKNQYAFFLSLFISCIFDLITNLC